MFYVIAFFLFFSPTIQTTPSTGVSTLIEEANSAFDQGLYKEAIPKYEQAISLMDPLKNQKEIADAAYKLGVSYLRIGEYENATQQLKKAFQLHEKLGDKESCGFDL
ncbi:tetratricopeptide repeat protein, partial [bacterium]|nr:tetratricopeptide repeat protein [bacterium]